MHVHITSIQGTSGSTETRFARLYCIKIINGARLNSVHEGVPEKDCMEFRNVYTTDFAKLYMKITIEVATMLRLTLQLEKSHSFQAIKPLQARPGTIKPGRGFRLLQAITFLGNPFRGKK